MPEIMLKVAIIGLILFQKHWVKNKSNMYAYYYIQLQSIEGTKDKDGNDIILKEKCYNFIEART